MKYRQIYYKPGVRFTKVFRIQFDLCLNLVIGEHLKFELMTESKNTV